MRNRVFMGESRQDLHASCAKNFSPSLIWPGEANQFNPCMFMGESRQDLHAPCAKNFSPSLIWPGVSLLQYRFWIVV